jgi:hypothetical protein
MLQLTRSDIQLIADTKLNGNMNTEIENIHVVIEGQKWMENTQELVTDMFSCACASR